MTMYQYTGSGLRNVWLINGYQTRKTPYGDSVSITDVAGLHIFIGRKIISNPRRLTGAEFRFLRKEQEMSQKNLAEVLGTEPQAINRWETGKTKVPKWADHFARVLFHEYVDGDGKVKDMIDHLNAQDARDHEDFKFRLEGKKWAA
jgi:DNA-binding transcriptional regulator YiaG